MTTPEENCGNCCFFRLNAGEIAGKAGTCRNSPPSVQTFVQQAGSIMGKAASQIVVQGVWPPVSKTEWCGRWSSIVPLQKGYQE